MNSTRLWTRPFLRWIALLVIALPAWAAASGPPVTLRVMTLNVFYGADELDLATGGFCTRREGCPEQLEQVLEILRRADADIVGIVEGQHNVRRIAQALGWHHSERTQTISRFPLIDPPGAHGNYVFADMGDGRVVAVANVHLPSDPYGPYAVRDGDTRRQVLELERRVRLPAMARRLPALRALAERGVPVFVVGDFNSPSHLDWTAATARLRPEIRFDVPWPVSRALQRAGFRDSFREVHPDPAARFGFTWTPGGPESAGADEVFDRIDWVLAAGPARALRSEIVGESGNPDVDIALPVYATDHRGVVSTYEAWPAWPAPYVAVDDRRLFVGDVLRLRVVAEPGSTIDIVGAAGALRGAAQIDCRAACATQLSLPIAGLAPGAYVAALRDAAGRTVSRSPFWLYAPGTPPSVATARPVYRVGEPIDVRFAAAPGMRWDWVAVYRAVGGSRSRYAATCNATACGSGGYRVGRHTDSRVEGTAVIDGSWVYDAAGAWPLRPGRYEVRLLLDDGYRQLAVSHPFEVVR